jgi:hypothetical protein
MTLIVPNRGAVVRLTRSGLAWTSRLILVAYAAVVLFGLWVRLSDIDTTMRIIGSDRACAETQVECSWVYFVIDRALSVFIICVAVGAQVATTWRDRDRAQVVAAVAAVAHFVVQKILYTPLVQ